MFDTALTSMSVRNFTAFKSLDMELSPGLNVIIGLNGTGKTHLLKLLYSACSLRADSKVTDLPTKTFNVFHPRPRRFSTFVRYGTSGASVIVRRTDGWVSMEIPRGTDDRAGDVVDYSEENWSYDVPISVFIPSGEILAGAAAFRDLAKRYDAPLEDVSADIFEAAVLPIKLEPPQVLSHETLKVCEASLAGFVAEEGEHFYLEQDDHKMSFTMLSEGHRRLGLLWRLINNGSLEPGSVLLWDSPEAGLSPNLMGLIVEILLELQRAGIQVILSTHSYVMLKELDLRASLEDRVRYFSLVRGGPERGVVCNTADDYRALDPNLIVSTYVALFHRDVEREFHNG